MVLITSSRGGRKTSSSASTASTDWVANGEKEDFFSGEKLAKRMDGDRPVLSFFSKSRVIY